jgi:hypothetical protein
MKFRHLCLIICLSCTVRTAFSQAPKYSNEFLNIGVGARSLGLGGAVTATTNDVTGGYWNPAGLTSVNSNLQLALMHSEYFAGIAKYDFGSIAHPLDSGGTIGFTAIRFAVDNIPNTLNLVDANGNIDYDRITTFSAADYAFIFSYAKKFKLEGLSVGANAKVIHRTVGEFAQSWGFGLDAGAQYRKGDWKFGAMAKDVTSTFNAWSFSLSDDVKDVFARTGNEIPENSVEVTLPRLITGASRKYNIKKFSFTAEADMDITFDGMRNTLIKSNSVSADPRLGLEIGFAETIFLRGGISNFQKVTDDNGIPITTVTPNMGVGVKIKAITLDYALTNINQTVGLYSNVFSLRFDLNKTHK